MRLQLAAVATIIVANQVAALAAVRLPHQHHAPPPLQRVYPSPSLSTVREASAGAHGGAAVRPRATLRPTPPTPRSTQPRCNDDGSKTLTLYPERWLMLGYLSVFALLSDWVCFSVAAVPGTWKEAYGQDPSTLIDIFLFTNVFFCFLEPTLVSRFGLRTVIVAAGVLMSVGCGLRSGVPFVGGLPPYAEVTIGTILVGAAQPFFQCTPPLLSATWFGPKERARATAIAINFNQVGIATAFLVGGEMANSGEGLSNYFDIITLASIVVAAGAIFQFQDRPPTPPSDSTAARDAAGSAGEKRIDGSDGFIVAGRQLLATPGFLPPLAAFVASIAVTNVVSAFVDETLVRGGFDQGSVDLAGAGFQAAIVVGGIILGGYVDRTRFYKPVTMACIGSAVLLLLVLGAEGMPRGVLLAVLLSLGALIGPVQPINAELAVEVSYPADENAIEAVQQFSGNLFSALLVPVAERAKHMDFSVGGYTTQGDTLLLAVLAAITFGYFSTFDAPLKRAALDCAGSDELGEEGCELDVIGAYTPDQKEIDLVGGGSDQAP